MQRTAAADSLDRSCHRHHKRVGDNCPFGHLLSHRLPIGLACSHRLPHRYPIPAALFSYLLLSLSLCPLQAVNSVGEKKRCRGTQLNKVREHACCYHQRKEPACSGDPFPCCVLLILTQQHQFSDEMTFIFLCLVVVVVVLVGWFCSGAF